MEETLIWSGTIPGQPKTKKNSQVIAKSRKGVPFILPSQAYRDYEHEAAWVLRNSRPKEPINERVNVKCLYYMQTRRKVDLSNLLESTHDILVHCGILEDDNCRIIASVDGSRVLHDKENPRVEIEITRETLP